MLWSNDSLLEKVLSKLSAVGMDPHLNHGIVFNTCSWMPLENSVVESYNTKREVSCNIEFLCR